MVNDTSLATAATRNFGAFLIAMLLMEDALHARHLAEEPLISGLQEGMHVPSP